MWATTAILLTISTLIHGVPVLPYHETLLYGNFSLGYYYIELLVGTPPQRQALIVDTGSVAFGVPCEGCTNCSTIHLNPRYDTTKSSSSSVVTCSEGMDLCVNCASKMGADRCEFSNYYAEGSSLEGFLVRDRVQLEEIGSKKNEEEASQEGVETMFGCITKESNQFLTQKADGILGLAPTSPLTLVMEIFKSHYPLTKEDNSFSICMADNGGVFTVGGLNSRLHPNQIGISARFLKSSNVYSLNITDIYVGKTPLNIGRSEIQSGQGVLIDSGATFSYFKEPHFTTVVKVIEEAALSQGGTQFADLDTKCFRFPHSKAFTLDDQIQKLPNITVKVNGGLIDWIPHRYLMSHNIANREVCLTFGPLDRFILGISWMKHKDVHFDLIREEITIYNSDCTPGQSSPAPNETTTQKQEFQEADVMALSVALVILVVFAGAMILFIFRCRRVPRQPPIHLQTQSIGYAMEEEHVDEISLADISMTQSINESSMLE